jgi:phenylpropionate dioxygenase-like ring-hydroxylating dioxygenase large terminal subunit
LQHVSRFIRNAWYMAAWSEELTDQLLSRRVFDRQIVLFRRKDGAAQALADRCPHRFAPLSRGTRDGDAIVCAYHGLRFDGSGRCVRNPYADAIPHQAQVDSWAVVERHDILWLWGGTTGTADPALIPDFSPVAESSQVHAVRGYTLLRAPYEYGIDNLMDLSHIEFVHRGSFAGNGVIFAGTHRVREEGAAIHSDWWMPDVAAPSHTRGIYPPDMRCDHWLDMRWDAPASMALQVGSTPKGPSARGRHRRGSGAYPHARNGGHHALFLGQRQAVRARFEGIGRHAAHAVPAGVRRGRQAHHPGCVREPGGHGFLGRQAHLAGRRRRWAAGATAAEGAARARTGQPLRVLVTGAAGFVGRAVVARLRDSAQVIGVDAVSAPGVDVHGDLADSATLSRCFAQPVDAVLHLATWPGGAAEREPNRAWHVNMDAARLLVDKATAQGHRPRFVFSSSIAVYGDPLPERIDDATPLAPHPALWGAQGDDGNLARHPDASWRHQRALAAPARRRGAAPSIDRAAVGIPQRPVPRAGSG